MSVGAALWLAWLVAAAAHDLQHVRQNETDSGAILVPVRFGAAVLALIGVAWAAAPIGFFPMSGPSA
ncbi:MAG: hypothetical protein H0T67_02645 [Burkholderiaceae bacterium]|nr:hypothetical protein [Burkholderiaceae bacterium]